MSSADPLDQATDLANQLNEQAIADHLARQRAGKLPAKGFCHNCQDPVGYDERFCDADCQEDYEYVQQRRRANGIA